MRWNYYRLRQLSLLQSAMDCYYKLRQLFYYKVRQGLLQIATGITKSDGFITNCDRYYKVRWLLRIATVQTHLKAFTDSNCHENNSHFSRWFRWTYFFKNQARYRKGHSIIAQSTIFWRKRRRVCCLLFIFIYTPHLFQDTKTTIFFFYYYYYFQQFF